MDVDPRGRRAARLRDARHRPAARRARPDVPTSRALGSAGDRRRPAPAAARRRQPLGEPEAEVYARAALGLRDYVDKNGFGHVVLGLSGGIDSALVACLAADALGAERVTARGDALALLLAGDAGRRPPTRGEPRHRGARAGHRGRRWRPTATSWPTAFEGREADITEENLQARIRGNLLMALSNKFGWLVLTTGNKSEMSVGYSTLYGDTGRRLRGDQGLPEDAGLRARARTATRRRHGADPASRSSTAPPAPSCAPDQRDEDSLPPYEVLDPILQGTSSWTPVASELVARGLPEAEVVDRIIRLVDLAEYKRRQAPPGIKITTRAFGRDRRMPITNRYREEALGPAAGSGPRRSSG